MASRWATMRKETRAGQTARPTQQLAADVAHLASLHAGLERTAQTLERARKAYVEAVHLLARVEPSTDGAARD